MKPIKIWRSLLTSLATLGLTGCAIDAPTAPTLPDAASPGLITEVVGGLVSKDALTRKTALTQDITVTADIGREGGSLTIPGAGLTLTVPAGAVTSRTKFAVTAIEGSLVAYEFSPHGLKFRVPLQAVQDLANTNYQPLTLQPLVAGYFLDRADLDQDDAKALLAEVIEGVSSSATKRFTWQIEHFSGYIVAW